MECYYLLFFSFIFLILLNGIQFPKVLAVMTPNPPFPELLLVATVLPLSSSIPPPYRSALNLYAQIQTSSPLSHKDIYHLRHAYPQKITILKKVVGNESKPWAYSLVGKFLGRAILAEKVHHSFASL